MLSTWICSLLEYVPYLNMFIILEGFLGQRNKFKSGWTYGQVHEWIEHTIYAMKYKYNILRQIKM
jgi:hypothetical protein